MDADRNETVSNPSVLKKPKEKPNVLMYSTKVCPFCQRAAQLLKLRGVTSIEVIFIDQSPEKRNEMIARTNRRTVPQIFIGDIPIGGYDDLVTLDREKRLLPLLNPEVNL